MKNNEEVLNLCFRKEDNIKYTLKEGKIVIIHEPQYHKIQKILRKIGFNIPKYKNIELDIYSSYVFLEIDGIKTIKQIGENLEKEFGQDVYPLYERLLVFINHIEKQCSYIKRI